MGQRRTIKPPKQQHDDGSVVAKSGDGGLSFRLTRTINGVHVRRVTQQAGRGRVVLSVLIPDALTFQRWCEADRQRHVYPLVYRHLLRAGRALFEVHDGERTIAA
jgi:hypothetical protein